MKNDVGIIERERSTPQSAAENENYKSPTHKHSKVHNPLRVRRILNGTVILILMMVIVAGLVVYNLSLYFKYTSTQSKQNDGVELYKASSLELDDDQHNHIDIDNASNNYDDNDVGANVLEHKGDKKLTMDNNMNLITIDAESSKSPSDSISKARNHPNIIEHISLMNETESSTNVTKKPKYLKRKRMYHCPNAKSDINVTFDVTNIEPLRIRTDRGIHIITSFFMGGYQKNRTDEIIDCLVRNLKNPYIEAVHVFWQDRNPREFVPLELSHKLITSVVVRQPLYFRFFAYASSYLQRGAIAIVTNSDIYFDSSLKLLRFGALPLGHPYSFWNDTSIKSAMDVDLNSKNVIRTVLALSRRHASECGKKNDYSRHFDLCLRYMKSHDFFIFAPPVPCQVMENTRFVQNRMGAENAVIYAFQHIQNYRLLNPCTIIKGTHLHCTNERNYPKRFIHYGYGKLPPEIPDDPLYKNWTLIF